MTNWINLIATVVAILGGIGGGTVFVMTSLTRWRASGGQSQSRIVSDAMLLTDQLQEEIVRRQQNEERQQRVIAEMDAKIRTLTEQLETMTRQTRMRIHELEDRVMDVEKENALLRRQLHDRDAPPTSH